MKKLIVLIVFALSASASYAQSCPKTCKPSCTQTCSEPCDKKQCKSEETALITSMRNDLQSVIEKASKSSMAFSNPLKGMTIEQGENDDESLEFMSQVASSIRHEFMTKLESAKLVTSLKDFKPSPSSSRHEMLASLKEEIQLLSTQVEKL